MRHATLPEPLRSVVNSIAPHVPAPGVQVLPKTQAHALELLAAASGITSPPDATLPLMSFPAEQLILAVTLVCESLREALQEDAKWQAGDMRVLPGMVTWNIKYLLAAVEKCRAGHRAEGSR